MASRSNEYYLEARSLDFGFYFLQLTVTTPENNNSIGYDYGFLEIIPGPLHVYIDGGSNRVVTEKTIMTLDGSGTYDSDWFAEPGKDKDKANRAGKKAPWAALFVAFFCRKFKKSRKRNATKYHG